MKCTLAQVTGFPYYGYMNITLSLDDDLVKRVRKIAVERDTTLTGLVRDHLEKLAVEDAASGRGRREREALERSFEKFQFRVGKRTWKREDLHVRS
ncbi:MAG: CopG family transcriptional regulator [Acidobacteriia bacterium]|nr:CopG family transcriptional regulator [Terriglobia bacterium]